MNQMILEIRVGETSIGKIFLKEESGKRFLQKANLANNYRDYITSFLLGRYLLTKENKYGKMINTIYANKDKTININEKIPINKNRLKLKKKYA